MALKLIVTEPFGEYAKGQEITDPAAMQAVLASERADSVLQVQVADAPASTKPAK